MKGAAGNGRNAVGLPLILTVTIHLGALLLALIAPGLVPEHLQIPEVYQVELYSAPEAPANPQPTPPPIQDEVESPAVTTPPPPVTAPAKVQPKPTISAPAQPQAKPKAVSLSPIKERLLRENREREERANRERTNRVTQIKLAYLQQQADAKAKEATSQAVLTIAETYRIAPPVRTTPVTGANNTRPRTSETIAPGTGASSGPVSPEIQSAYKDGLRGHIGHHWSLPDLQGWDKSLKTVINIKMKSNGMVAPGGVTIASTSGNPRFDKEARKAVNNSLPLPPLPPEFGKNGEEIAVTFTPGGLK